jgi:rifampicin phosphotransferase
MDRESERPEDGAGPRGTAAGFSELVTEVAAPGLLLDWETAADAGSEVAGGKGWNLGQLWRYGLPVPEGVVLVAGAYRLTLQHAGLAAAASQLEGESFDPATPEGEASLDRFQAQIEAADLPAAVSAALAAAIERSGLPAAPLAVRSSGTAEDGEAASFAGMHHTSLNVPARLDEVAAAVKRCYASLWTPHAVAYRRRHGLAGEVAMAVVLMRLIPAQAAGVAFTADPQSGRRDRVVVTANHGLGESVVGGTVDPDAYQVFYGIEERPKVGARRLGRKERQTLLQEGGGTRDVEQDGSDAGVVLTDAQVLDVATLALRCQDAIGQDYGPQDVEWAYDGERFWIMQSRPITTFREVLPEAIQGQPVIWSTANLKEVLPAVYSPYGWSMVRFSTKSMFEGILRHSGYEAPDGMHWIRLYQGHPYFNLSLIQWVFFDAYGIPPVRTNRMLGGQQPAIQLPPGGTFAGAAGRGRMRRFFRQLLDARTAFTEVTAASEAMRRDVAAFQARDFSALDDEQMQDETWKMAATLATFSTEFMRANTQASTWLDLLLRLLERLLPERGHGLATRLLAGTGNIASAEQGYRLVEIARLAAIEPQARRFFLETQSPLEWERELSGTATGRAFAAFLQEFGHRGVNELEIANPRWVEDPSYLVETVREHILNGLEAPPDPQAARTAAETELRRALRFHPAQPLVWWILSQARKGSALRENAKSVLVLSMLPFRRVAAEVGKRLTERGVLPSLDGLFFLTVNDIEAAFRGLWDGRGATRLIADRRARYDHQWTLRLPDVLIDDTPMAQATSVRPATDAGGGQVFEGLGVAAGRASGPARVILHPREGHKLQKGEVLVAPTTDPGWTPLFLRAAALVMETGGYLSHGAIVAREYGIPAVANVPGVLDLVHDGDDIVVDGEKGHVVRRQGDLSAGQET